MAGNGLLVLLSLLAAGIFITGPVQADMISPAITHVYFEKDGVPYNGSVQYAVNCYGYTFSYPPVLKTPGSYQPELVYHYSAGCREYGCSIYEPYYLTYTHIDWCDLEGTADGSAFVIRNFSSLPYTRCNPIDYRMEKTWGNKTEYYYYTPEYSLCRKLRRTEVKICMPVASPMRRLPTPGIVRRSSFFPASNLCTGYPVTTRLSS
jgi:hypothetical protein